MSDPHRPAITFTYCTQCNWLLRTARVAQALLSSFGQDIGSGTMIPGDGGVFQITLDGAQIWDRKDQGGFPEARQLRQRIRDRLWPDRDLGHLDGHSPAKETP